jgi:spore germination protein PE
MPRAKRTSVVSEFKINSMQFASAGFVGDNLVVDPKTKVIAVQREIPEFLGDEGNFNDYPLFSKPIPQPTLETDVTFNVVNESPWIQVDRLRIIAMSTSAVAQVGSTVLIDGEYRVKQFRQLLDAKVSRFPPRPEDVAKVMALAPIVAELALELD